jgi:hypothetical protein
MADPPPPSARDYKFEDKNMALVSSGIILRPCGPPRLKPPKYSTKKRCAKVPSSKHAFFLSS